MQASAESAAVLTHACTPAGFFDGYPSLSAGAVAHVRALAAARGPAPAPAPALLESRAESMGALVDEMFSLAADPAGSTFGSVADGALREVNRFVAALAAGRGPAGARPPGWSAAELLDVLNHNLSVLRAPVDAASLPAPGGLSLELLYGLALAHHRDAVREACPVLDALAVSVPFATVRPRGEHVLPDRPSERRCLKVCRDIARGDWRYAFPGVNEDAPLGRRELIAELELAVRERWLGSTRRSKARRIVASLRHRARDRDRVWSAQRAVKALAEGTWRDYRSSGDVATALADGLGQALANLRTDIQVSNMGVLRDPRRHFLHAFLEAACRRPAPTLEAALEAADEELAHVARVTRRLRAVGMYASDWRNNVARAWNDCRRRAVARLAEAGRPASDAPPPMQWDLAIDLVPEAHAFAFTYGRAQGYCVDPRGSAEWLARQCSVAEVAHFAHLLAGAGDPAALGEELAARVAFLKWEGEGGERTRAAARKVCAGLEPRGGGGAPASLAEAPGGWDLVCQLWSWPSGGLAERAVRRAVDAEREALPEWLKDRAASPRYLSPTALFFAAFRAVPAEDFVLEGYRLMSDKWRRAGAVAVAPGDEDGEDSEED